MVWWRTRLIEIVWEVLIPLASTSLLVYGGWQILQGELTVRKKLQELYELGNNASNKEKSLVTILELVFEMYKRGFKFKEVDLYKSNGSKFTIEEDAIRPPLSCLVGVGVNAANSIYSEAREGEFMSKEDLRLRCKISKTVIETLDGCGALKGMDETNQLSFFNF
jgi:DNA polymerase-3 subunit alpha (Gram-positive type)